jgi:RimJ/RimL family protein N-acetyltransferase
MIKVDKLSNKISSDILSDDSPSFSGIVTGDCKGELWVDDPKNPSLALVYSSAVGGFSILGSPQNDNVYEQFNYFLNNYLLPSLKKNNVNSFEFSVESSSTQSKLLEAFSSKEIKSELEFMHRNDKTIDRPIHIPEEYKIEIVDSNLVNRFQSDEIENQNMLADRLLNSWNSYEIFYKRSIAFAAFHQNKIVAVIVGTARFNDVIPIDIETDKQHRNKGLASALTHYFVNKCVDDQLVAQWDCIESNTASKRIAIKSGFKLIRKRPFFWFDI